MISRLRFRSTSNDSSRVAAVADPGQTIINDLADDAADPPAILDAEGERNPHVEQRCEDPVGHRQGLLLQIAPGVVAAGIRDRFGVPEPLELHPAREARLHELADAGLLLAGGP